MARQPIDEKCVPIHLGFWQYGFNATYTRLSAFGFRLSVTCNDGTNGIVDMSALVNSSNAGIFAALKDAQLFQQVNIELGAITWPNGADLDPVWVHEEISKNKTWSVPV